MKFVDSCEVRLIAGNGGNGCVAFRREKFVPHGGPSGGDGGRGGDVVFEADLGMSTLLDFTHAKTIRADSGEPGRGSDCYGKGAEDRTLRVPLGTQVFDVASGELVADIAEAGARQIIARGGKGGRGNIHFATSFDRAPRRAEPGVPGEERLVRLELKVMADVGLLGFPNVGKSTFIRACSAARPKVAEYPFTTLVPHLGVVSVDEDNSFVMADIPGLIPGASEGAGLGIRFLKHVERTRALLHLITLDYAQAEGRDPVADYDVLMNELAHFDPALAKRPMIVAMSQADRTEVREAYPEVKAKLAKRGVDLRLVSAVTGEGVKPLIRELFGVVKGAIVPPTPKPSPPTPKPSTSTSTSTSTSRKKTPAKKPVAKKSAATKPAARKMPASSNRKKRTPTKKSATSARKRPKKR